MDNPLTVAWLALELQSVGAVRDPDELLRVLRRGDESVADLCRVYHRDREAAREMVERRN